MKKYLLIFSIFFIFLAAIIFFGLSSYLKSLKAVSSNSELKEFVVNSGETYYSIATKLYDNHLIKSKLGYKIYIKLNPPSKHLEAGIYYLSENMNVKRIVDELSGGSISGRDDEVTITIKEGININKIASVIATKTDITEQRFKAAFSDNDFIDELIEKYWFITSDVKKDGIYYSLEGYLYPNTYQINKYSSAKDIIMVLLDEEEKQLSPYKEKIENSSLSIHEIMTLASVVEAEAKTAGDRKGVAGVFINRLDANMNLGSDVTTYYGVQVDMGERDLYVDEINDDNKYNTRNPNMAGKLPIGPICNPSITSIEAVLNPDKNDYYYFVSDKNGKIHFAKNYQEHNAVIRELKANGMWYVYE